MVSRHETNVFSSTSAFLPCGPCIPFTRFRMRELPRPHQQRNPNIANYGSPNLSISSISWTSSKSAMVGASTPQSIRRSVDFCLLSTYHIFIPPRLGKCVGLLIVNRRCRNAYRKGSVGKSTPPLLAPILTYSSTLNQSFCQSLASWPVAALMRSKDFRS
jgi:hypothetical protein